MKLFNHQLKYSFGYKDKELVVHEGGTGKTVCAAVWIGDDRDDNALVVCPKRVVKKWEEELAKWDTHGTVISKEQFRKDIIKIQEEHFSSITIDEADEFASPLFLKSGRSGFSTALYNFIRMYPDMPILLLTATPIRSNPWNLHTLLCFKGYYIPWEDWREAFFTLTFKGRWSDNPAHPCRPYLVHPSWLPKEDWRQRIRYVLERNADIVLLRDCIKDLPPETSEYIHVKCDPIVIEEEWTPTAAFVAEHKNEQLYKADDIISYSKEYRKVLVVAYYTEDCERLEKQLSKDRKTYMVNGQVKNQEGILKEANADMGECYLIVQASLGVGFDADTFSLMIFTSMSYGVRDWVQMKWRARRIHNLHPIKHLYLLGGRCDEAVLHNVQLGKQFVPSEWQPR